MDFDRNRCLEEPIRDCYSERVYTKDNQCCFLAKFAMIFSTIGLIFAVLAIILLVLL